MDFFITTFYCGCRILEDLCTLQVLFFSIASKLNCFSMTQIMLTVLLCFLLSVFLLKLAGWGVGDDISLNGRY